jgi:hypothetical protein
MIEGSDGAGFALEAVAELGGRLLDGDERSSRVSRAL